MNRLIRIVGRGGGGSLDLATVKQAIEQMTEVSRDHLTPELALRLVTPNCQLWTADHQLCPFPDPFWAFYWPGGQGLTRYLLDNAASLVSGKRVLDVGSGCGSLAIAATTLGTAASVTANDIDPVAAVAIEMNASLNGCKMDRMNIITEDIIGKTGSSADYDCILLGDMFYDETFTQRLMDWLLRALTDKGTQVLIGDPGRSINFFKRYQSNLEKVAVYSNINEHMKTNGLASDDINVWKLVDCMKFKRD